jgi:toxin HigB-1
MWTVYESDAVVKTIKKLPKDVLKRYEKWKDIIGISGLLGLRAIKGFHDEKLHTYKQAYRSSRLGDKYRVIYHVKEKSYVVQVIRITPHDYRRLK